ncbi:MAG: hypothetical protein M3357_17840, partial [Actinomycetota bacterium]|nr:hypothetical protein [Actinomycetota bacterium]
SLTGVNCDNNTVTVLADTELLRVEVGTAANMAATPTVIVNAGQLLTLSLLGAFTVNVLADSQFLQNGASPQTLTFTGPYNWSNKQTIGGGVSLADLVSDLNVTTNYSPACGLLCGALNGLLVNAVNDTVGILTPVLNNLDSLLNPLLNALGVSLGGADFFAWDLDCHARSLVG